MGEGIGKVLRCIGSDPVIRLTVKALINSGSIDDVVVLHPEGDEASFRSALAPVFSIADGLAAAKSSTVHLCPGGKTRKESVYSGLRFIEKLEKDLKEAFVLVHDGARCLVTTDLINRTVAHATESGSVTAAVPIVDTVVSVEGDGIERFEDRSLLRAVQTPQMFSYNVLRSAHESCEGNTATDDASLVRVGEMVATIPGERTNIKLTTPEDFLIAEAILEQSSRKVE